jgi:hypothetical protein
MNTGQTPPTAEVRRQTTPTEAERHEWLRLVKTWLRMIKPHARTPDDHALLRRGSSRSPTIHSRSQRERPSIRSPKRGTSCSWCPNSTGYLLSKDWGPGLCRFGDPRCGQTPSWSGIAQSTDGHFLHIVLVSIQSTSGGHHGATARNQSRHDVIVNQYAGGNGGLYAHRRLHFICPSGCHRLQGRNAGANGANATAGKHDPLRCFQAQP